LHEKIADREKLLCFQLLAIDPIESRDGYRLHARPDPGVGEPGWRPAPRVNWPAAENV